MFPISSVILQHLTKVYVGTKVGGLVRTKVLPALPSGQIPLSGRIPSFGTQHLQVIKEPTAARLPAPEIESDVEFIDFRLQPFRRKIFVTDEEMADYELPMAPVQRAVKAIKANREVTQEYLLATAMRTSANYAAGYVLDINATSNKWDTASADPRKDVLNGIEQLASAENLLLNLTWPAWKWLVKAVQDELLNFQDDRLKLAALASHLGIAECSVAAGWYNAAGTKTRIWGTTEAWLTERPTNVSGEVEDSFGFSASRDEKVTTPRTDDPDGVKVIGQGKYANAFLKTVTNWDKSIYFTNVL